MSRIRRRQLLEATLALGGIAAFGTWARAATLARTPAQTSGPFYPLSWPADVDVDLTRIQGRSGRAQGQVVEVVGRVLNTAGEPVPDARIEIWQANTHGRSTHPRDSNPAPLDPNFDGVAKFSADAEGRYRFRTIKPGSYPAAGALRPAHIHLRIAGARDELTTQMYFAGDPLLARDPIYPRPDAARERLVVALQSPTAAIEPGAMLALWDIVLERG
jgi:protocatechuate 3,4-dioxygenase beta subunit